MRGTRGRIQRHRPIAMVSMLVLLAPLLSCSHPSEDADRSTTTTTPDATTTTTKRGTDKAPPTSTPAGDVGEHSAVAGELPRAGAIAYVGCSVTADTIQGYHAEGGERFWPREDEYGGTISRVRDRRNLEQIWDVYDRLAAAAPPVALWWQLCMGDERDRPDEELYSIAVDAMALLREHAGNLPVFVSAQPEYVPPASCKRAGTDGPQRLAVVADRLAEAGLALRGPDFPSLHESELRDNCHPNAEGGAIQGQVLLSYFG